MKGMFLKALSLTLLVPAAMVVAVDPVVKPTVDSKVVAETAKTVEAPKQVEAPKAETPKTAEAVKTWGEYASEKFTAAKDAVVSASNSTVELAKEHPYATAGIATAAVAGLSYLGYRYFSSTKDANVKSAKAAATNGDLNKAAQVVIPTIKVELIDKDITLLNNLLAAAQVNVSSKSPVALTEQKDKDGKLVFDLNSLTAVKEAGLEMARRLPAHVMHFDRVVKAQNTKSIATRHDALVRFVKAVIKQLNFIKTQNAATEAAAKAKAAAGTTSDANAQTWSEYVKSFATLKSAAVATGVVAAAGLGYYYFPAIKAALGFAKETASTAVLASAASKVAKEATAEAPKTEAATPVAPKVEATSNVAPQAVAKPAGLVAKK